MQQVEVHYLIHIRLLMLDISTTKSNSSNQFISTSDSRLEVRVRLDEHKQLQLNNLLALASAGKTTCRWYCWEWWGSSFCYNRLKSSKNQHWHRTNISVPHLLYSLRSLIYYAHYVKPGILTTNKTLKQRKIYQQLIFSNQ